MPPYKLINVDYRGETLNLTINLEEAKSLFKLRFDELLPLLEGDVKSCLSDAGLGKVRISRHFNKVEYQVFEVRPTIYGRVKRCLSELEARVRRRFQVERRHFASMLFSLEPMDKFRIALYSVDVKSREEGYRVTSLASRQIFREQGLICDRLGFNLLALPLIGAEEPAGEFSLTLLDQEVRFKLKGLKEVDYSRAEDRELAKRLVNKAVRKSFASFGFKTRGPYVFEKEPKIETESFCAFSGAAFHSQVLEDGTVVLMLAPKHELISKKNLWQLYGSSLKSRELDLRGRALKKVYSGRSCVMLHVRDAGVSSPLPELNGISLLDHYDQLGVDTGSIEKAEPVVEVARSSLVEFDAPSMLTRVYTLKEAKEMGVSKDLLRLLVVPPTRWKKYMEKFTDVLKEVDLGFATLSFPQDFLEVEVA